MALLKASNSSIVLAAMPVTVGTSVRSAALVAYLADGDGSGFLRRDRRDWRPCMARSDWAYASWYKSRRSQGDSGCVECAFLDGLVGMRDTKDRSGPFLVFGNASWGAFIAGVKCGDFDL
jgi:hypothetical protein